MNIILDYDGTIHDTLKIYAVAFRKVYDYLVDNSLAPSRSFTDGEIAGWLGYSPKEMWDTFMPDLPREEKIKCSTMVGDEMARLMKNGEDRLYDGALETLEYLKSHGHTLIFLSNCKHSYMENHRAFYNLDKYYSGFYCTEDYNYASKPEIFLDIQKKFPGKYLVVGDRFKDIELGEEYDIPTVGCLYGFGDPKELAPATYLINSITELKKLI